MSERPIVRPTAVPRLPSHVKLRFDRRRDRWVVLAPERVLMPDETALEVLNLCDGATTVAGIVDALAGRYVAAREDIDRDVREMLQELADKGFVRL